VATSRARGGPLADAIVTPPPPLRASAIIEVLNRHGVRYVVIGAYAAIAQQAPIRATRDIDFTPDTSADNLERLSAALKELGARIRTADVPEGLPFDHGRRSLGASSVWNLICADGEFDISFRPSGFEAGYEKLRPNAHLVRVDSVDVLIADLEDVIRSKESAGRAKDLQVLPTLYRFLRDQKERGNADNNDAGLDIGS
jgi:hypothetical protein